jgi:hypothetical protein
MWPEIEEINSYNTKNNQHVCVATTKMFCGATIKVISRSEFSEIAVKDARRRCMQQAKLHNKSHGC